MYIMCMDMCICTIIIKEEGVRVERELGEMRGVGGGSLRGGDDI